LVGGCWSQTTSQPSGERARGLRSQSANEDVRRALLVGSPGAGGFYTYGWQVP